MKTLRRSLALLLALGSLASCEIILRRSDGTRAVEGRYMHTALWTGKEMLVGGGNGGGGGGPDCDNEGCDVWSLYDPAADAWRTTYHKLAPGRNDHTAVWTGTELLVWGGLTYGPGSSELSAVGVRFNPASGAWGTISGKDAPSPRANHSAVWTGTELVVWGGGKDPSSMTIFGDGGRYDPKTDRWTPIATADAPAARAGHGAVWTGKVMIVWGGYSTTYLDDGGRYDPATDRWTPLSSSGRPAARRHPGLLWTGSEVIVVGGHLDSNPPADPGAAAKYDPATDTWHAMAGPPASSSANWFPAAAWAGNELVLWHGSAGARYLATNTWETLVPQGPGVVTSTKNLQGMSAVWTGTEVIFWGGNVFSGGTPSQDPPRTGLRYNPTSKTWRPTAVVMPDEWN